MRQSTAIITLDALITAYASLPTAVLTTTKSIPQLQPDLDKEAQEINRDIKDYKLFPVIQFGFSYKF
jgi:hypothetical protein